MPSVRETAVRLGATGTISVVHDLFRHINSVPAGRTISLRSHIAGIDGPHIKVNLIRVSPATFTAADLDSLDVAIADIRTVYQQVDLGDLLADEQNIMNYEPAGIEQQRDIIFSNCAIQQSSRTEWRLETT
jgi:hypothetical protein